MGIMCADQKQGDRHHKEEFLRRGVLRSIIDLLPHVEVVICARVEIEGHAAHVVEHQIRAKRIGYVGKGP